MRVLLVLISVACVAIPIQALAKPKPTIAVAPLQGDTGNKVAQAVADALAGRDFAVVEPKDVKREMAKLGLSDELDTKDARKLTKKLDVAALVDGQVSKAGKKRSLHLEVHRRGKPDAGFTIEFKSTDSDGFRRSVHDEIVKKLEGAGEGDATDDDDQPKKIAAKQADDDTPKRPKKQADDDDTVAKRPKKQADDDDAPKRPKKQADDDDTVAKRPKKQADDDDTVAKRPKKQADDDPPKRPKKQADDDDTVAKRPKKQADDDDTVAKRPKRVADDDEPAVRKRKKAKQLDEEVVPPPVLARVGAGGSLAQRRLTYDTRSGLTAAQAPPSVVTTAGAGRVDGEIYPIALASPGSALAGLGLAGEYDKTFGLAIKIPNKPLQAPIDQAHYAIGARYRFGVGASANLVVGLDYARRHYIADRSGLTTAMLDAPDVDYTAVAPGIAGRLPVTPAITLFGGLDGMLLFDTGPIQKNDSYGPATVYGVDVIGGLDIAITKQIGLRAALEYSQINFSFTNKGQLANSRDGDSTTQDVMGATDRSIGASVTLGLTY